MAILYREIRLKDFYDNPFSFGHEPMKVGSMYRPVRDVYTFDHNRDGVARIFKTDLLMYLGTLIPNTGNKDSIFYFKDKISNASTGNNIFTETKSFFLHNEKIISIEQAICLLLFEDNLTDSKKVFSDRIKKLKKIWFKELSVADKLFNASNTNSGEVAEIKLPSGKTCFLPVGVCLEIYYCCCQQELS